MTEETQTTIVRIYCDEGEHIVQTIVDYLHGEAKVRGVSVFRGIEGFGASGNIHTTSIIDLSTDLPIIIEFFDLTNTANKAIKYIRSLIKSNHIISWPVTPH